jgi:hypothetical protein
LIHIPVATTVQISPAMPVPMAGRGGAERIGFNIDCGIEANILLLPAEHGKLIAIVALDALFGSTQLRQAIWDALGADETKVADIVLVASHTHNAPTLDPMKPGLGRCDLSHLASVARRIGSAICRSLGGSSDRNMLVLCGRAECTDNAVRRRFTVRLSSKWPFVDLGTHLLPNRRVVTPHTVDVRLGTDVDRNPKWLVWSWPCHATSYFDNWAVSPDFPGTVRDSVRAALGIPDLPIVYLPGFCGDIRSDSARSPVDWKRRLATPLARPFAESTAETYAAFCDRVTRAVVGAVGCAQEVEPNHLEATLSRDALPLSSIMDTPIDGEIALVHIDYGSLNFLFMGAETCSPYYALLAPLFPENALLSGYADAVPLYLPDDRQIAEGGYEAVGFRHSFGLPGSFHPKIESTIISAVSRLQQNRRP